MGFILWSYTRIILFTLYRSLSMRIIAQGTKEETSLSAEHYMSRLALESSFVSNVVEIFKSAIPSFQRELTNAYHNLTESDEVTRDVKVGVSHFTTVKKKLPDATFVDYANIVVSVPEGFNGKLLPYLVFLNSQTDELFKQAYDVIGAYKVVLSTFISDKENKTSLKDNTNLYHRILERREEIVNDISHFFPKSTVNTKKRLSDILDRFNDLPAIVAEMEKLNDARRQNNLSMLSSAVREVVELLDIIVKEVQADGVKNVSGNAAMNISKGAYEIGKYIEFIAVFCSMVDVAVSTSSKLIVQLDKVL